MVVISSGGRVAGVCRGGVQTEVSDLITCGRWSRL